MFDIKTDVVLTVYKEPDMEKIKEKFLKADVIYVGGGDTVFMMEHWKKTGLLTLIQDAYERGIPLAGCPREQFVGFPIFIPILSKRKTERLMLCSKD